MASRAKVHTSKHTSQNHYREAIEHAEKEETLAGFSFERRNVIVFLILPRKQTSVNKEKRRRDSARSVLRRSCKRTTSNDIGVEEENWRLCV